MTNHSLPDHGAAPDPGLAALAPIGGKRRPVKVVEHPAFRHSMRRRAPTASAFVRVPVVSLNRPARALARTCRRGARTLTLSPEAL